MHSVLEGVIKNFFNYWFDSKYSSISFSLRKNINEIDQRLLIIKPPSFVQSAPRSIREYSSWRAKEFLYFIIYYAIPCFFNIMNDKCYYNLIKLIIFMEFLLSKRIKHSDCDKYQNLIQSYLSEVSSLYLPSIMLSGMHELVHLIDITKKFGTINTTNCFVYEEMNRKIIRMINGKDLVGEEFIKLFSSIQCLSTFVANSNSNNDVLDYIRDNFIIRTSNKKFLSKLTKKIKLNDIINNDLFQKFRNIIQKISDFMVNINEMAFSINFRGIRYNAAYKKKKFNDSFIKAKDKFGVIEVIFKINDEYFVLTRKLIKLRHVFVNGFNEMPSLTSICFMSKENYFIENIKNIEKTYGTSISTFEKIFFIS